MLRAPLLLKQALQFGMKNEAVLSGSFVDFGSYRELVTDGSVSRDVKIVATIGPDHAVRPSQLRSRMDPRLEPLFRGMDVEIVIHWNQRAGEAQYKLISFSPIGADEPIVTLTRRGPDSLSLKVAGERPVNMDVPLSLQAMRFLDLPHRGDQPSREDMNLSLGIYYLGLSLQMAAMSIIHIGPLRDIPQRSYRTEQLPTQGQTDSAVAVLRSGAGLKLIERALQDLNMASEIKVRKLAPGFVAVSLHDPESGRADNLADVGFGVSQVLPILATLATAPRDSTVLIEQPELHLHPEAQGALADVLFSLAKARRLRLVIETHSEHLLLRLRRRTAEDTIAPDELAVYFIDQGVVTKAEIDPLGRLDPSAMPSGFFDEDWQDLMRMTEAAAKRTAP